MALAAEPAPPPVNPCTEPAKHLVCPDWTMMPIRTLRVRSVGKRQILMMDNTLINVGQGPVEFRGRRSKPREMTARQVLARTGGRSRVALVTGAHLQYTFVDRARGSYWKFAHAARFELWRLDGGGRRTERVRVGPKLNYCNRDLRRRRILPATPLQERFPACPQDPNLTTATIGTSVGWIDAYPWHYPNNWVEITGQKGCFAIVQRADPLGTVLELREDNNTVSKVVRLPFRHGPQRCPPFDPTVPPGPAPEPEPPAPEPVPPPTTTNPPAAY